MNDSLEDLTQDQLNSFFYDTFDDYELQKRKPVFYIISPVMKSFVDFFEESSRRGNNVQSYVDYLIAHGDEIILKDILISEEVVFYIGFDNYLKIISENLNPRFFEFNKHMRYFESLTAKQRFKVAQSFVNQGTMGELTLKSNPSHSYFVDYYLRNTRNLQLLNVFESKRKFFYLVKRMFDGETYIDTISLRNKRNIDNKQIQKNSIRRLHETFKERSDSVNIEKIVCVVTLKNWVLKNAEYYKRGQVPQILNTYNYQNVPYHEKYIEAQTTSNVSKMNKYSSHSDSAVRQCLANNEQLPDELFKDLAQDTDDLVRLSIAINPKTPLSILEFLFDNENKAYGTGLQEGALITLMVAMHENSDMNLLQKILVKKSLSKEVYVEALLNINQSYEYVQREFDKAVEANNVKMLRTLALSDKLDYEQLMKLVECEDTEVSFNALANSGLPNAVRNLLLEG